MEMVFTRGIGSQPGVAVGEEYKEISQQWGNWLNAEPTKRKSFNLKSFWDLVKKNGCNM